MRASRRPGPFARSRRHHTAGPTQERDDRQQTPPPRRCEPTGCGRRNGAIRSPDRVAYPRLRRSRLALRPARSPQAPSPRDESPRAAAPRQCLRRRPRLSRRPHQRSSAAYLVAGWSCVVLPASNSGCRRSKFHEMGVQRPRPYWATENLKASLRPTESLSAAGKQFGSIRGQVHAACPLFRPAFRSIGCGRISGSSPI
jgi:hypothetical protein